MRAIYFSGSYCPACRAIERGVVDPAIERGSPIEKVDVMRRPKRAMAANIVKVPTLIAYRDDGTEAKRLHVGEITDEAVRELLG